MSDLKDDDLARAVCWEFEPNPPVISARDARAQTRGFAWVSCHDFHSPLEWWEAEIGTDHGPASEDDLPVRWRPVEGITSDIGSAWRVVDEMKRRGWLLHILQMTDGWVVNARRYDVPVTGWADGRLTSDMVQVPGDDAAEAICRAAFEAMTKYAKSSAA